MPHRIAYGKKRRPTFFRQWRAHRGLSQERLAERLDTSVASVSRIETGRQPYTQDYLEALAGPLTARRAAEAHEPPSPQLTLDGYLIKPDGAGPFPAIVLLHGCAGLPASFRRAPAASRWVDRLVSWGFAVLAFDSFAARKFRP